MLGTQLGPVAVALGASALLNHNTKVKLEVSQGKQALILLILKSERRGERE